MKSKTAIIRIGIAFAILLLVVAIVVFTGYFEKKSEFDLQILDIKVENPKPSLLNNRAVTIDPGESVTLCVTIQNKGEEIIYRDAYSVGIGVVYPPGGAEYWILPAEQLMVIDMGPGGKSSYVFNAWNRKENPFSGKFKIQAYVKSVHSGDTLARSDNVTVEMRPPPIPTPIETETSVPGFEAMSAIAGLITVMYLIRRQEQKEK